ncbi:UPF0716 protein FxsA [Methylohalomonas lacus]|uniref:UPF0716 protein FxsA n=1 Tax=Methylohalomonas lacus TaxID=398773 RepID=A0AAE3HKH1_9GAMM|nr:FxsA family protein [Methylohalomonas lacus]MCS3903981.1 UPF0716 protein FxsA [Methylohalomonas lacus]
MHPSVLLLLIFIVVPLVEIGLFIQIGGVIGALPTIGLIILTAVIGVTLIRLQGVTTLTRIRDKLNRDEIPATDMVEGLMLLVAAVLLLTPGFFTDAAGFLLLVPALRRPLAVRLLYHLARRHRRGGNSRTTVIINGEVVDTDAGSGQGNEYPGLKGRDRENYN